MSLSTYAFLCVAQHPDYVTTFDKWLWEVYFPQHFPDYERYRARYIGLPAPKTRKHLPSPMNRAQAVHARFGWE